MTKTKLQSEVMDWLLGLPEGEDYTSALIVARFKADNDNGNSNVVGFTGEKSEYMQCIGALAENGHSHGYLHKTIPLKGE